MARSLMLISALLALALTASTRPGLAQPAPVPEAVDVPRTLRLPLESADISLDPHAAPSGPSLNLIADIYEGLMQWLPGPSPKLAPCLAADWPKVSDDGLTYTFKLREAKFHNSECFKEGQGRAARASDIVASFKRLAAMSGERQHWFWLVQGLIAGLDKYAEDARERGGWQGSDDEAIEGLSAPDDSTFVLKLKRPFAPILSVLAHPALSVIAAEAMDHYMFELQRRAVGTGPYRLHALAASRLYVLKRFDRHWGEKPEFERVVYAAPEGAEAVATGQWGECELDASLARRHVRDGKLFGPLAKAPVELSIADDVGSWFMSFNMSDAMVGSLDADGRGLRKAVSLCIDRARMAESCFGAMFGRAAAEILPPGAEFAELGRHEDWGAYDLKRAKDALDATKFRGGRNPDTGNPLSLTLFCPTGEFNRRMVEVLREGLKSLGVGLDALQTSSEDLFTAMDTGQGHLYFAGWFLDHPDPQNIFQLYDSRNIGTGEENRNTARYSAPEFDADYAELCRLSGDAAHQARRRELVGKLATRLLEDRPVVPLMVRRFAHLRSTNLEWPALPACVFDRVRFIKTRKS